MTWLLVTTSLLNCYSYCYWYCHWYWDQYRLSLLVSLSQLISVTVTYPLRQAICNGSEQAPRLISIFRDKHHRINSKLFSPTQICKRLYPSSLCICKIFSDLGILHKSPSNLWTPTFGFAHKASKMIRIFLRVCSDAFRLWEELKRAWPDWKKCDKAPPIL